MQGLLTCWVLDHPAHLQLFRGFVSKGSNLDLLIATRRPEVETMLAEGISPLPKRETVWVKRPAGKRLLPLQRELRALNRMLRVRKALLRRQRLGHPIERIITKGAPLELWAAKRAKVPQRWYLTDTEVHHLAHRLALSSATDVVLPSVWREDLDGGFLSACRERGVRIHFFEGALPHAYLSPPNSPPIDEEEGIPRILHRTLEGGGAHDKGELVSSAPLVPNLGMRVLTVAEGSPVQDPWGLPSSLTQFDGVLSESVTLAQEAVCQGVPTLLVTKGRRGFLDEHVGDGLLYRIESTNRGLSLDNEVATWREAVLSRRRNGLVPVAWSDSKSELEAMWR